MNWSVLVVEGSALACQEVNDALTHKGLKVRTVSTVAEGYAALLDMPNLVVLDADLPGAMDFCAALKRNVCHTPVILLSAKRREDDIVHGFEMGADDYLIRPVGMGELASRVMAQLRHIDLRPQPAPTFQAA